MNRDVSWVLSHFLFTLGRHFMIALKFHDVETIRLMRHSPCWWASTNIEADSVSIDSLCAGGLSR